MGKRELSYGEVLHNNQKRLLEKKAGIVLM